MVCLLKGGDVFSAYEQNPISYANGCALRLSQSFNYGGMEIKRDITPTQIYRLKGGDGKEYVVWLSRMIDFVYKNFGGPDIKLYPKNNGDVYKQILNQKGIIIFKVKGWTDTTGHVTLWNGGSCGDHCYFIHAQSEV